MDLRKKELSYVSENNSTVERTESEKHQLPYNKLAKSSNVYQFLCRIIRN